MPPHTLHRTGRPPLQFVGNPIAHADGRAVNAPATRENADHWRIDLYRVAPAPGEAPGPAPSPLYVVAIEYVNDHRGRDYRHHVADVTDDPAEALAAYNPLDYLRGFPPGEQYAARQAELERHCRRQWDVLVSTVLAEFPEPLDASPLARAKRLSAQLRAVLPQIPAADQGDREALADAAYDLDHLDACLADIGTGTGTEYPPE